LSCWLFAEEKLPAVKGIIKLKKAVSKQRALLPRPLQDGVFSKIIKLGEAASNLEN
jgi:hypothetical protein